MAALLVVLAGFASASTDARCRDHDDLSQILAARERIVAHGPLVWPGWTAPPSVLLRSGEVDCLIDHPRPPDGFEIDGNGVTRRPGRLLPQPAATAWPVNGVWSVAVPARDELQAFLDAHVGPDVITLDAALYERVIVHEAFHAHQLTVLGGPEGEAAAAAARFLDLRRAWRAAAPPGTAALERELEWLEGTARYADVLHAVYPPTHPDVAADHAWEDLLAQLRNLPAIQTGLRDRYAALGAGRAFALDRLYRVWKNRAIPGGESMQALLQEAVGSTAGVPRRLADLTLRSVPIGGERWRLLLAQDEAGWTRGLLGVTSLGGADGMLFVFPEDVRAPFWTRGASLPLDVAFFDREGRWLGTYAMATCESDSDPCPVYRPDLPYRYALETTPGRIRPQMDGAALDR